MFVPRRVREVGVAIVGSVVVPLWIAAPLLLPILAVAALTDSGLVWAIAWAGLGLTALVMTGLALALVFETLTTTVRWIEFRPHGSTQQLVIARFLRSSTVAAADLQRVILVERFKAGQRKSLEVVLHARGGTVKCEAGIQAPMFQVSAEALVDWLTSQLSSARIALEHRTEIDRSFVCPDEWYTQAGLAALWQVPASAVDELVVRHGIRTYQYTPRAAAMFSPDTTTTVFDPAGAHDLAEELRKKRTMNPQADGTQETPHP